MNKRVGVRDLAKKKTKTKKEYYDFKAFVDGKATSAKIWDISQVLKNGDIIDCEVTEDSYKGKKQFIARDYSIVTESVEKEERATIFGVVEVSGEDLLSEIANIVKKNVKDTIVQNLIIGMLSENEQSFISSVAARSNHHNYKGGLISHTLNVLKICLEVGKLYENINMDILVAGAILHDIGKIKTYTHINEDTIEYTERGHFYEHLVYGSMMVRDCWKTIGEAEDDIRLSLISHCILSHHGEREWGSPVKPVCKEAQILHLADMIDSRIGIMDSQVREYDGENNFTDMCYNLGSSIYIGENNV